MGATLFYFPNEWRSIIGPIKSAVGGNTKVGVNVNWEKICGCPSHLIYSTQYYTVSPRLAVDIMHRWLQTPLEHFLPCPINEGCT